MTHPVGIGLVGVGLHGIRYARHILQDMPAARLAAVCRRHPEHRLSLPGAESVKVYGEARSLVADPDVEVVIIVTPPILTREISRLAIQARKPVLIEKPLAVSVVDAAAIVAEAEAAGVPLMTGQTLRFDSTIQELTNQRERIGESRQLLMTSHIETKERGPEHAAGYGRHGALLEIGVHLLDLVRHLTGEEVSEARCTMNPVPPEAPDSRAAVRLTTRGGTTCVIDVARVPEGRVGQMEWVGTRGRLWADWSHRHLRWTDGREVKELTLPPSQTVRSTLAAFLEAVEAGKPMPITGMDGYRAVEIADACYRSAQAGGLPVALPLA